MLATPLLTHDRPGVPSPTVLLVSSCPWTARALEVTLGDAGFAPLCVSDVAHVAPLRGSTGVDALLIDERAVGNATPGDGGADRSADRSAGFAAHVAGIDAPPVPLLALVRDPLTARETAALHAAGVWGIVPYPVGAGAWVEQLALWTRSTRAARRGLDAGLVDPASGLYNLRGLEQRGLEIDATARRQGGPLACGVFALGPAIGPRDRRAVDRAVAEACRRAGRASDVFGRIGDGEFAIVAPGADEAGLRRLVDRIAAAMTADGARRPSLRLGVRAVPDAVDGALPVARMLAEAAQRLP